MSKLRVTIANMRMLTIYMNWLQKVLPLTHCLNLMLWSTWMDP